MPFDGTEPGLSFWSRIRRALLPKPALPVPFFPPADVSEAVQALILARALIEDRKDWVRLRYETLDGRRCAVGALRGAARLMNIQGPQTMANTMLLSVAMSRGFNDIESMNDNSSHRQVLSAFDEAIARARQTAA